MGMRSLATRMFLAMRTMSLAIGISLGMRISLPTGISIATEIPLHSRGRHPYGQIEDDGVYDNEFNSRWGSHTNKIIYYTIAQGDWTRQIVEIIEGTKWLKSCLLILLKNEDTVYRSIEGILNSLLELFAPCPTFCSPCPTFLSPCSTFCSPCPIFPPPVPHLLILIFCAMSKKFSLSSVLIFPPHLKKTSYA